MAANVRCAGLPALTRDLSGDPLNLPAVQACGWKGKRVSDLRAAELSEDEYRQACTAKPCPRCGGRVELIPDQDERGDR